MQALTLPQQWEDVNTIHKRKQSKRVRILRHLEVTYPFYTALVIGLTRERFVAHGLPS